MEYQGMIVNIGMRFDWFDANFDNYPSDLSNPVPDSLLSVGGVVHDPTSVSAKYYWSPRLGVAYPFTEKDQLHFSYGKYFQTPQLRFLYNNVNYDFSGAFPMVGNPNIDPERTTGYEIGWKHQFTNDMVFNLTGYFKDITGLTDTQQRYYTFSDYYTYYINTDYGNIRGFEFEIYKRRTVEGFWAGTFNYTYGVAKGKSSSFRQNYDLTWAGDIVPTTESYLDWDERHVVKANLDVRIPVSKPLLGIPILSDMGVNTIFTYASGEPYSPPSRSKEPSINTERLPWTMNIDLTFDKRFRLGGNRSIILFAWVRNLLDRKNVIKFVDNIWADKLPDVEWYHTFNDIEQKHNEGIISDEDYMVLMDKQDPSDVDNDGLYEEADGKIDYNKANPLGGPYINPMIYDWGRTIRFGVEFQF
jgi:outer membrane receptor protein involved in Fe transport